MGRSQSSGINVRDSWGFHICSISWPSIHWQISIKNRWKIWLPNWPSWTIRTYCMNSYHRELELSRGLKLEGREDYCQGQILFSGWKQSLTRMKFLIRIFMKKKLMCWLCRPGKERHSRINLTLLCIFSWKSQKIAIPAMKTGPRMEKRANRKWNWKD